MCALGSLVKELGVKKKLEGNFGFLVKNTEEDNYLFYSLQVPFQRENSNEIQTRSV